MKIKILYRYDQNGITIDSLIPLEGSVKYIERYRLVADENMALTKDNEKLYSVIDIDQEDLINWVEVEQPEDKRIKQVL